MITIKEEFVGCDKYVRALEIGGAEAIVMWLALKRYAAANLTDGFIPDEKIEKLAGVPKRPRKALQALVDCGELTEDGARGDGLVDKVDRGWKLHDYDDHANSSDEERLRKEKARAKKAAQRAAKRAELDALLASRGQSRGQRGDSPGDNGGTVPGTTGPGHSGARPLAHVRAHAPSPAQPSPAQPSEERAARAPIRDRLADSLIPPTGVEQYAFAAWATAWGKTGAAYDPRRAECLSERVRRGMTAQDADDAIAGALADEWVNGTKDGEPKTKLTVIFGSAESFEDYRDKGKALRERPSGTLRKVLSVAERQAADASAEAARRAAKGLPPLKEAAPVDAAELDRLIASVGGIG